MFLVLTLVQEALNLEWPLVVQVFLKGAVTALIVTPLHPRFRTRRATD